MPTMTCPPAEQLKAFYLGKLADDHSEELATHVGNCTACQTELETVIDAEDSLIADLRAEDVEEAWNREPACELGVIRALGALAGATEPERSQNSSQDSSQSVHAAESDLPKSIGEYEVVRALGRGGMGRVYLARHCKLGRLVALKILAGQRLGDRRAHQRFEAEMRAIGRLSHPNIVTAHDAREIEGTAVLVTEFVDGFDLGELLRRTGPLAIPDACEIVRQVAIALQYTSDQGFVHRDVKPSNVMLSSSGEVKLLDLGLARLQYGEAEAAEFTATGQTMGTADYISPEQVTDSRKVDVRSDIYSLGATLYKLLVGRAPFADEKHSTTFAKMTAHVSTIPTAVRSLRGEVPEDLSRLVAAMLAKTPEDRPQQPASIAQKLASFASGNDLQSLARKASSVDTTQIAEPIATPVTTQPRKLPVWLRPVKLYVAIAAGFAGMLLGLWLGIIITIKNPDGSKTIVQLPEGSSVEVSEGVSDGTSNDTWLSESKMQLETETPALLEFGVILDKVTTASKHGARVVALAKGVEITAPMFEPDFGENKLAMISLDPKMHIRADELWGHILSTKKTKTDNSDAIELSFDESLSRRMLELTTLGQGQHLAIIVEGKIVAAPRINSPISNKAMLSGVFTPENLNRLQDWLNAAKPVARSNSGAFLDISRQPKGAVVDGNTNTQPNSESLPIGGLDHRYFHAALHAFARCLSADRTSPIAEKDVEQLATAVVQTDPLGRMNLESVKSVIRKSWPFQGVTSVLPGLPAEASWLLSDDEAGYTLLIDPQWILTGLETLVDELANQKGFFDVVVNDLAKDPTGPRIDVQNMIQHLGNEMLLCVGTEAQPVRVYAFTLKNPEALQKALQHFNDHFDEIRIVKNLLVFGNRADVDRVTSRVVQSPDRKATNNLKMLGIAFGHFEATYRQLPASKNDREGGHGIQGRAKHPFSWRVAILPFVEHAELFEQYDFNEPWDSEKNLKLLDKMPDVFRSPRAPLDQKAGETNYLGFSGDQCAMGDRAGVPLSEIRDGTSATVLLVESKRTVPWTKPEDLTFTGYADAKLAEPFDGLSLNCLMVDGSVLSLESPIDWERLGRLVTRDGGEPLGLTR